MYDIVEDEKEDAEKSDDDSDTENLNDERAIIPYQPILTRPFEDMNHAEAQEEIGESLMLMFDHVR